MKYTFLKLIGIWLVGASLIFQPGCTALSNATIGQWGAKRHSYALKNEKTGIVLLTYDQMKVRLEHLYSQDPVIDPDDHTKTLAADVFVAARLDACGLEVMPYKPRPAVKNESPALAAALLPLISDFIVNQVQTELTLESSRYKHQFTASATIDNYFGAIANPNAPETESAYIPQYAGLEVYRAAKRRDGTDSPEAFEMVAALVPAPTSNSNGVLLIRPLYMRTNDSSAKIAFGDAVSTDLVISQSATIGAQPPATQPADVNTKPQPVQQQSPAGITYSFGANKLCMPVWFWTTDPEAQVYDPSNQVRARSNCITIGSVPAPVAPVPTGSDPKNSPTWIAAVLIGQDQEIYSLTPLTSGKFTITVAHDSVTQPIPYNAGASDVQQSINRILGSIPGNSARATVSQKDGKFWITVAKDLSITADGATLKTYKTIGALGGPNAAGILQLTVQVTESDPGNAQQDFESVSKIVQSSSSDITKTLNGLFGLKQSQTPAATKP